MRKRAITVVLALALAGSMAACGSTGSTDQAAANASEQTESAASAETTEAAVSAESTDTADEADASTEDVIKVRVAGTPGYKPYTYVDENDQETGFDIEVIRAIDEIAPEIECEFTYSEWDTLLPGLDADKFDVVSGQLFKTEEREEMYLFPQYPFLLAGSAIMSAAETPIDSYEDLTGKKVGAVVSSSFTTQVEMYLEEHPGAFTIEYLDGDLSQALEQVVNGRVDATVEDPYAAYSRAEVAGIADRLHISDYIDDGDFAYFLFAQTDKGQLLADIFDKYLPVLYYNGTLAEIAEEYLGSASGVTGMAEHGFYEEATLEEFEAAHQ